MSKPFFYRITAADFLAAVVTVPEADRASWVLSLALDMVGGDADTANSQFAKDIINEAGQFKLKKAEAGRKGGQAKASSAKAVLSSALAKPSSDVAKASTPLARSSNSNSTTTEDINPSSQKTAPVIQNKFDDEDLRFAEWMFSQIECLPGSHKKPNFKKWANTIRLMRERDGHSLKAIGMVFKWANNDDFWNTNILSPSKLRDKFSQLSAKALKPESAGNGQQGKKLMTFEQQKVENSKQAMRELLEGGLTDDFTGSGRVHLLDE